MPIENQNRPSEYEDEHGMSKPQPHPSEKFDAEHPGYETTDVNTRGVVVFLAGLMAFLVVFFLLCFAMGKAINYGLLKQDGDEAKLSPQAVTAGGSPAVDHKRVNLPTNPYMEQKESARLAQSFPTPASTRMTVISPPAICTLAKIFCWITPRPEPTAVFVSRSIRPWRRSSSAVFPLRQEPPQKPRP